ncbi:MAG: hypothetical protein O3A82_06390 [Verrucomicrobia bacterium]|nr:hypothetical protein [Verrucomicrobiota bacterium]MDA0724384.1 hypothetical protein [Verrucomicrobiota bacterium]MDA1046539.1 hypothetical protein [Verrucomicrobiota bacterium]
MNKIPFSLFPSLVFFLFHFSLAADEPRPEKSKVRLQLDAMRGKPAPKLDLKGGSIRNRFRGKTSWGRSWFSISG